MKMVKKNVLNLLLLLQTFVNSAEIFSQALHIADVNKNAISYVGNSHPENGLMQLELLLREGLQKDNYVLEIGCGALVAGIPIMSFLEKNHYLGIDPNKWLIDSSLLIEENQKIINDKQPSFLYNEHFDASNTGIYFNYVISHSIISHAPLWQLRLFLQNCSKVLKDGGKVIFSLRLTEPNEFDGLGIKEESTTSEWQYPGNTFFHKETVIAEASLWFKKVEHRPLYTKLIMSTDKAAIHDWFVLTK